MPTRSDEGHLFYRKKGRPTSPQLVFLHSLGTSSLIWRDQLEHFRREYRVLAPDYLGHGRSPAGAEVTLDTGVGDLVRFAEREGLHEATWVGLSMGGTHLLQLWALRPDLVGRLVLAGSFASLPDPWVTERLAQLEQQLAVTDMRAFAAAYTRQVLTCNAPYGQQRILYLSMSCTKKAVYLAAARATFQAKLDHVLDTITVPAMVLIGESDDRIPRAAFDALSDQIPGASTRVIVGAGHLLHLDDASQFNAELEAFLRGNQ